MNENDLDNDSKKDEGFFKSLIKDDGVQRSFAGVAVAVVIAGIRRAIFGSGVS